MKFWCFLLMGHKWRSERRWINVEKTRQTRDGWDDPVWSSETDEHACCLRCGTPNPNYGKPVR